MAAALSSSVSGVVASAPTHSPPNPAVEATLIQLATVLGLVFVAATIVVFAWVFVDELLRRRADRQGDFGSKSPMAPSA
ncbi:MAG: hypothetical protein Q7T55_10135 [Solirubrobacteraceae bacterium]|nr:hypothetical protein [Solirubrobacteraceae bacterium]